MERNCHLVQTAVFAALFAAILVMNTPVQSNEAVLYDRLGGRAAIDAVVEQFNARVMADDALATYFTKTDMPSYRRPGPTSCTQRRGPLHLPGTIDDRRTHSPLHHQGRV